MFSYEYKESIIWIQLCGEWFTVIILLIALMNFFIEIHARKKFPFK